MAITRNVLFYPKRTLIDSIDEEGEAVPLTTFSKDRAVTFRLSEEKGDNLLGEGRFAKTYRIESGGWLAEHAASFCKARILPNPAPGVHDPSAQVPCFYNVRFAALKEFRDGVTFESLNQAKKGDWVSWQLVAQCVKPSVDEFRTLAYANGANGHTPKPYALGWIEDGDKLYPAVLMEYLGNELIDKSVKPNKGIKTITELRESLRNLTPHQQARIAAEAAIELGQAVRNLHRTGIVHRDLSTGNVLFLSKGDGPDMKIERAFLIDLGNSTKPRENQVSLVYSPRDPSDGSSSSQLSRQVSPVKMTTLGYGAPEVLAWWREWNSWSRRNDAKTDCFSVAALLYFLINGDPVPDIIRQNLGGKYVINWKEEDFANIYPEEGYPLDLESTSSELADALNLVVRECTIRNPELRRDLDWLLATLWNATYPNIAAQNGEHHSYSVIGTYTPASHDALCDIDDFDPLAFLCDLESALNNWAMLYGNQGLHGISTEDVGQGGSTSTVPFAQDREAIDDSFGPVWNPSIAPVSVVTDDMIPIYVAPPRRKSKAHSEQAKSHIRNGLLTGAEIARINEDYPRNATTCTPLAASIFMSNAQEEMSLGQFEKAAQTLRGCMNEYYPAAICYTLALCTKRFVHVTKQNLVSEKALAQTLAKAARAGYTDALCTLGILLSESKSPDDWGHATKLLKLGYEVQRDGYCANNLGVMMYKGRGAEKSLEKALEWFETASDLGCEISQANQAICYMQEGDMRANFSKIANSLIRGTELGVQAAYRYLWLACTSINWEANLLAGRIIAGQGLSRKSLSDALEEHEIEINASIRIDDLEPMLAFPRIQ